MAKCVQCGVKGGLKEGLKLGASLCDSCQAENERQVELGELPPIVQQQYTGGGRFSFGNVESSGKKVSNNLKHRVFPHEASHKTVTLSERERNDIEGFSLDMGCSLTAGICVFIAIFSISIFGFLLGVVLAIASAPIIVALIRSQIKNRKISDMERKRTDEANRSEVSRVTNEAENLTSSLICTHQSSTELANALPEHLSQASAWLQNAEKEYEDNAFSPFWDAVENAAQHLAFFNDKANALSGNAGEYYRKLNGRKHTFSIFPVQLDTIPDPSDEIEELRRIVRLGQTNFQFANIWEHRRTREVLIAGFRTLGEAVNNLGSTIENSISNLQQSISSDLARVVDEQIKTRESVDRTRESIDKTRQSVDNTGAAVDKRLLEQNRMLDNIQHDREPKLRDIPSKH